MNKKDKNSNSQISDFINITYASDFMDVVYKNCYIKQVEKILKDNNVFDSIVKDIRLLNKKYEQDGSYVFNKFVENLKTKKYPKNIEKQIIKELQQAFLVKVYEKNKEEKSLNEYLKKLKIKQYVTKDILHYNYNYFDNDNLKKIGDKIASAPIEIQKLIVDMCNFRYFTKPSEEIITYAFENKRIYLNDLKPQQRNNNIDIIAAKLGAIYNIKEVTNLSKEAKLTFIENNPEKIITKITAKNYDTKNLTIYDLDKQELETYNKALEKYKIRQEQKQIELVKKDPTAIYEIENPSSIVKNYAISTFRKQWER